MNPTINKTPTTIPPNSIGSKLPTIMDGLLAVILAAGSSRERAAHSGGDSCPRCKGSAGFAQKRSFAQKLQRLHKNSSQPGFERLAREFRSRIAGTSPQNAAIWPNGDTPNQGARNNPCQHSRGARAHWPDAEDIKRWKQSDQHPPNPRPRPFLRFVAHG